MEMLRENRYHNEKMFSLSYWKAKEKDSREKEKIQMMERMVDRAQSLHEREADQRMRIEMERAIEESVSRQVGIYSSVYTTQHNAALHAANTLGPQHPLYPKIGSRLHDLTVNQTPLNFQSMDIQARARLMPSSEHTRQFGQILPATAEPAPVPSPETLGPYASLTAGSSPPEHPAVGPGGYQVEPGSSQMGAGMEGVEMGAMGAMGAMDAMGTEMEQGVNYDDDDDDDEGSLYDWN
jgi:hypothetical protein